MGGGKFFHHKLSYCKMVHNLSSNASWGPRHYRSHIDEYFICGETRLENEDSTKLIVGANLEGKYQKSIKAYQEYRKFSPIFELLFSTSFFMNSHFNFILGNGVTIKILEYSILYHITLENVEEL